MAMLFLLVIVAVAIFTVDAFAVSKPTWIAAHHRTKLHAAKDISMPALSSTMKEGKIIAWNKKVGEKVSAGEVLLVVESDKADMDVEAFDDGYLAAIHTPEGGIAAVGAAVATLVDSVDEISSVGSPSAPVASTPATPPPAPASAPPAALTSSVDFKQIDMPALSSTMKEGKIVSWSKNVGDKIDVGDMVFVVESDKADMDVESYESGYLAAVLVKEGEVAPVGKPVCLLAKSKEDIDAVKAVAAGGPAVVAQPTPAASTSASIDKSTTPAASSTPVSPKPASSSPQVVNTGHVAASGYAKSVAKDQGIDLRTVTSSRPDGYITSKDLSSGASVQFSWDGIVNASPMARKLAKEHNVDLSAVQGSGNFNRVTGDDILRKAGKLPASAIATPAVKAAAAATTSSEGKAAAPKAPAGTTGVTSMDAMQKAVAKNMEKTLSVPIFHVTREIITDSLNQFYAKVKPKGITMSALIAKAVAMTLTKHPLLNAFYVESNGGGAIQYNADVNIAMAVAIDGGLITPTMQKVQDLDLFSIGRQWKELVDKAKAKKLSPKEYSSGTFTISNLGMFGVKQFDAILPYGMGSILAISSSRPTVAVLKNGHFGVQEVMEVTLTCDHRHIYGAHAAEFLRDLADLLENHCDDLLLG